MVTNIRSSHLGLLIIYMGVLTWSAIAPFDYFIWFLEVFPALLGLLLLIATYQHFQFTTFAYIAIQTLYPDGVWLERADGQFYDAADGGTAVFSDLAAMSFADESGNGKQDYAVAQVADDADKLLAERAFMRDQVCGQCHTRNFAFCAISPWRYASTRTCRRCRRRMTWRRGWISRRRGASSSSPAGR